MSAYVITYVNDNNGRVHLSIAQLRTDICAEGKLYPPRLDRFSLLARLFRALHRSSTRSSYVYS